MIVAFSISPSGVGPSVGASVARAVRIVRESGLPNETNAMFTNVEGEWDEVMALVKRCVDEVLQDSPRVGLVMKVDIRTDKASSMEAKLASIEAHLEE